MTLKTIYGEPVKNLSGVLIVSADEAAFRVESKRINQNRLRRLGLASCVEFASDTRMPDHEYEPEDFLP